MPVAPNETDWKMNSQVRETFRVIVGEPLASQAISAGVGAYGPDPNFLGVLLFTLGRLNARVTKLEEENEALKSGMPVSTPPDPSGERRLRL